MSTERPIIQLGNPTLRQLAQPVEAIADTQVQQLIDDLLLTVQAANGVGIAAPQVAQSLRLLIVASRPNPRYPQAPVMEPTALINPRLIAHSGETVKGWEGCLSIPGVRGLVPRYREIEVEYLDRCGAVKRVVWTDFVARIFQHEYDHLEGKVFLDRVESTADLMTEQEYKVRVLGEGADLGS
ncbi:peptide deformylase [Pseudanabaena sp. FACHB-2040]|uniref:peptide deformylase n=1 Tax=Pseudanabaena sp. FACHB-2040 TaxID=2692859 RepID=UPI00168745CC|nr:peptide deformylase [Pseudanabaena sp. FACHB-2040]MBD2259188.1 peptide deformylase [Pseudanabaena sp. FACHB-2040]